MSHTLGRNSDTDIETFRDLLFEADTFAEWLTLLDSHFSGRFMAKMIGVSPDTFSKVMRSKKPTPRFLNQVEVLLQEHLEAKSRLQFLSTLGAKSAIASNDGYQGEDSHIDPGDYVEARVVEEMIKYAGQTTLPELIGLFLHRTPSIAKAVSTLRQLGLVFINPDKRIQSKEPIHSEFKLGPKNDQEQRKFLQRIHSNVFRLVDQSLGYSKASERVMRSGFVAMDPSQLKEVEQKMDAFFIKTIDEIQAKNKVRRPGVRVYWLGNCLVPLTRGAGSPGL